MFVVAVVVLGFLVVWATSYPGLPISMVVISSLLSLLVLVIASTVPRRPAPIVLSIGATVLITTAVVALITSGTPRQLRFAASEDAFAAVVAGMPAPTEVASDTWTDFPADCPAMIGSYTLSDCRGFDGGYLFLQHDDAVTDDSGIAYLPSGPRVDEEGLLDTGLTHLDGPWWSWTCNC